MVSIVNKLLCPNYSGGGTGERLCAAQKLVESGFDDFAVTVFNLKTNELPVKIQCRDSSGSGAHERVENKVARI